MENAQEELMETAAMPDRRTYTVPEAAKLLGISRGQGYALARTGELPGAIKLGGRIVVSRTALDRVIAGEAEADH
jgi:excisionase family DNA binding protein